MGFIKNANVKSSITDSAIAVPVDVQFSSLPDSNPVPTKLIGSLANDITLLDAVTVVTTGTYVLQGEKTITIEIYGTSASRTINFQGKGPSGTARTLMGTRISDLAVASSTTTTGEIWQFDVTGLVSFITDLTAVAGGSVTVKGRAVV